MSNSIGLRQIVTELINKDQIPDLTVTGAVLPKPKGKFGCQQLHKNNTNAKFAKAKKVKIQAREKNLWQIK